MRDKAPRAREGMGTALKCEMLDACTRRGGGASYSLFARACAVVVVMAQPMQLLNHATRARTPEIGSEREHVPDEESAVRAPAHGELGWRCDARAHQVLAHRHHVLVGLARGAGGVCV